MEPQRENHKRENHDWDETESFSKWKKKKKKRRIIIYSISFFFFFFEITEARNTISTLINWRRKEVNCVHLYSQVVLPLERLAAHRAHIFPLVTVRQLVLRERRCVVEHLPADLPTEIVKCVSVSLYWCSISGSQFNWLFMISRLWLKVRRVYVTMIKWIVRTTREIEMLLLSTENY